MKMNKDVLESVRTLKSPTCDCGKSKDIKNAFCIHCWLSLPPQIRFDLKQRIGNGFEGALKKAREILNNAS